MLLHPWEFQDIRILSHGGEQGVLASCALCGDEVAVPLGDSRPVLRLALGIVTPPALLREHAAAAALELDAVHGAPALLGALAGEGAALGELGPVMLAGLLISLDEMAEAQALEAEWRQAEEMAAIVDGELTDVPGFDAFRKGILGLDS
jgi:hypothetical protein